MVKTVVIGLGRMGMRHVQVAKDLGLDLIGVSDLLETAREQAAADFGLSEKSLFEDAEAMIESLKPQCVIVATTAPSHADYVCLAAANDAERVLCEKPMSTSLDGCDRMIEACKNSGTRLAVNHQMRFMEQYTRAKEILSSEEFGGVSSVNVVAGNFGMAMNGIHYFEMFRYITDDKPVEVSAWFSDDNVPNPRGAQFEDKAGCIRITTLSGKRFYMDAGTDHGHGMFVTYAGPYGQLNVDELSGQMNLAVRKPEHRKEPSTRYGMPWLQRDFEITPADSVAPTRSVLSALLNGEDYPAGDIGRIAVEILVAAYVSDENGGRTVDLRTETMPTDRIFPWA